MSLSNNEAKTLCLSLLLADTEEEVIQILKSKGYWDNSSAWRLYGDKEGNFATAGSQQAEPEAALVEKIINSVDASLINKCLLNKIEPESVDAPDSIREAVAVFYEGKEKSQSGGSLVDWSAKQRRLEAKNITLAATGTSKYACLTIADLGEGQSPNKVPNTILSLNKKNKQRIRFVQGKFNMGGTGVLRHCHENSFQLVISRRNQNIVEKWNEGESDDSAGKWGFTIVRRERPSGKAGEVVNSEFKYLAPILSNNEHGEILRFNSDSLPLMPDENDPYCRKIPSGTAMKLYGLDLSQGSSNVLMPDGLLYRLEALLPDIALPVRLHECRKKFAGAKGSFETNLAGLTVRLEDGKGGNLECAPWDVPFSVRGLKFTAKIYVFKKGKSKTYLNNQGIIFTINGQTHGTIPKSIFGRKKVGLTRIGKDTLVVVDCSKIPVSDREDLFMSSRDRLSKGVLRSAIERQLEEILRYDSKLRSLQEERRVSEQSEKLDSQKPLEEVLRNIFKTSPGLTSLFLHGSRLSMPKAKGEKSAGDSKSGGEDDSTSNSGSQEGAQSFIGKKHPTYFRFEKSPKKNRYKRGCELTRSARVAFETDVENGYFSRPDYVGTYELKVISGDIDESKISHSLDLDDGSAQWIVHLPNDVTIGEKVVLECVVNDEVLISPFVNTLELTVKPKTTPATTISKPKISSGAGTGNKDNKLLQGLALPQIVKVKEGDDAWNEYKFNNKSGCEVIRDRVGDSEQVEYTFYINVDNVHFKNEIKLSKEPEVEEAKYLYGNVLLGLSILHDSEGSKKNGASETEDEKLTPEESVRHTTRAMSPFILPMINYLGNLSSDEVSNLSAVGDEE